MNFFKSILSDDAPPENLDNHEKSGTDTRPNQSQKHQQIERAEDDFTSSGAGAGLWSFGDLVKTITARSESVLDTYRRDLKEFGSGLRKESDLFREVASRAVKELPSSIEVGASAIDGVLKSTADIISQGKDVLLEPSDDSDRSSLNSKAYSRFDSQLNAIQRDKQTYCEDPEDLDDYSKWKLGFVLNDYKGDIDKLMGDDEAVESMYEKLVPDEAEDGSFWCRYFYKVDKLKQQEDIRANFVRRSLTIDDEEELSWDVDDDEEEEDVQVKQSSKNDPEEPESSGGDSFDQKVESVLKSDEDRDGSENVGKDGELVKEEEDLEWDEIEDIGKDDEKKVLLSERDDTVKKGDLLKRIRGTEEDEDLNWDIEDDDDDEPVKAGNSK